METIRFIYNTKKSYSIVVKQEKANAQNPNPILHFFIFDMEEEKIVYQFVTLHFSTDFKYLDF